MRRSPDNIGNFDYPIKHTISGIEIGHFWGPKIGFLGSFWGSKKGPKSGFSGPPRGRGGAKKGLASPELAGEPH